MQFDRSRAVHQGWFGFWWFWHGFGGLAATGAKKISWQRTTATQRWASRQAVGVCRCEGSQWHVTDQSPEWTQFWPNVAASQLGPGVAPASLYSVGAVILNSVLRLSAPCFALRTPNQPRPPTHHRRHDAVAPPAPLAGLGGPGALLLHRRDQPQVLLRGAAQGHPGGGPLQGRGMGRPQARLGGPRRHQHLHLG